MANYYWYDKYELVEDWNLEEEGSLECILIRGGDITRIDVDGEGLGGYYGGTGDGVYTSYEVSGTEVRNTGFDRHYINPSGEQDYPISTNQNVYDYFDDVWYDGEGYQWKTAVAKGYITYSSGGNVYWHITDLLVLDTYYKIYYHAEKGELLEKDVVKDDSYPKDGYKDGFWWIRKKLFTIPAPELISPDNAFVLEEGDDIPYFVFELQGRDIIPPIDTDNNDYHVRLRMGEDSDFKSGLMVEAESKESQSGWEYYNESSEVWETFTSGGVPAYTKVRYQPDLSSLEFGFFYWSATAHNPSWGYGADSTTRSFISVINAEGELYILSIDGKEYRAIELSVKESSNGELGSMEFTLMNHRI